jgi:DNA-binding transcriptional MocR family regulator
MSGARSERGLDFSRTPDTLRAVNEPFLFQASGRLVDFMRQADEPGLINLAAGVPAIESLPAAELRAAFDKAHEDDGARIFAYHHPEGDHRLRALFAERLSQRGARVSGPQVLTTTGCQQALQLMLTALVKPGDIVACQVPAYYALLELIAAKGARILPLPERSDAGFDVAEVTELLECWRPKCLFVCTTLSNPSGSTMTESAREELVKVCRRLGVRIIEDDIYAELVDGGAPKPMLAFDDGTTVSYVTSFSKSVSPGLRAGFCVPGSLFEQAATLKCQDDMHGSVVSEGTLRAFFEMDALAPHLARLRERNLRRRALAREVITRSFPKGTHIAEPLGGYMLWVRLPDSADLAQVKVRARAKGVVFCAGDVFFPAQAPGKFMRLNCAKASESELVRGLEILGAAA